MSLMISISGIRGTIGDGLTPEVVVRYASAFAAYCKQSHPTNLSVVVGRDGRITGPAITDVLTSTLMACGMNVRDIGICPTPTVQIAVEQTGAAGGIAITASHNPMQWNGMKFIAATGMFLDAEENHEFWGLTERPPSYVSWDKLGTRTVDNSWIRKHIDEVLSLPFIAKETVQKRKFRVVLDCINAAGGVIVPELLKEFGCEVIPMNCDVSGVFARTPEPIPENLTAVAERVKAEKADLGIVVDPDVDRLVLINEYGEPYGEEYTIATAVKFVLAKQSGAKKGPAHKAPTVVVNLSTTRAVNDIAAEFGANVIRTPVGEINVARKMKEVSAIIGGEGSGGVILPAVHLGRDAIVGIGLILQFLAESGKTLSGLRNELPLYYIAKGKVELGKIAPDEVMREIQTSHGKSGTVNTEDGLKIDFPQSWVHLRTSNTEPIMRIIAEARNKSDALDTVEQLKRQINSYTMWRKTKG